VVKTKPGKVAVVSARKVVGWLGRSLFLAAVLGLLLGSVLYLGHLALGHLHDQKQFKIQMADIECQPPPGMTRVEFLDEVQYQASLPSEFSSLDKELPRQLAEAFAQHSSVKRVEQVQILPPNQVRVRLRYRQPVLAVPWEGKLRAVDGGSILLPPKTPTEGLPVFAGKPQRPQGSAGTPWGDPAVAAAAQALEAAQQPRGRQRRRR
jgi:hypothetical protein